mgnify:CR=1 FL=1
MILIITIIIIQSLKHNILRFMHEFLCAQSTTLSCYKGCFTTLINKISYIGLHSRYRFIKGLTKNLNLRTNVKIEFNIKSRNYIQLNFCFQTSFLYYWTMSFTFFTLEQWFKSYEVRKWLRNLTSCITAIVKRYTIDMCSVCNTCI